MEWNVLVIMKWYGSYDKKMSMNTVSGLIMILSPKLWKPIVSSNNELFHSKNLPSRLLFWFNRVFSIATSMYNLEGC